MKRVIEINEEVYNRIKASTNKTSSDFAILNSTPLNEVLDEMSGEIKGIKYLACPQPEEVIKDVLDIINKCKERESE